MDKKLILDKYKKEEDKLLIAKLFDKISAVEKQNRVQNTDFLSPVELQVLTKVLQMGGYTNYTIYGVTEDFQRSIIVLYPEKLEEVFNNNNFNFNSICNTIRIFNNGEKLEHKMYLGGLIKLGVKREKIGDILVTDEFTDIIVLKEVTKFLISNLQELTRFKNSNIEIIDVKDTVNKQQEFEEMKVIVSSLRLDNIVAELARTSRNKASEILEDERVFINYEMESKSTKQVKEKDIITIRGKGKFVINEVKGNTRSGKFVVGVLRFSWDRGRIVAEKIKIY